MKYVQDFIIYWIMVFGYIWCMCIFSKRHLKEWLMKYLPLATVLHLVYWLIRLRIDIDVNSPFQIGGRAIYEICAKFYFIIAVSVFAVFVAKMTIRCFRKRHDKAEIATYLPFLSLYIYLLFVMFSHTKYMLLSLFLIVFIAAYALSGFHTLIKQKILKIFDVILQKEYLFIILIFVIAFVTRYLFALRIISMTGDNFLRASDDGLTYAPYAVDLLHGRIPSHGLYWGGYGYWVFLSVIYRYFGEYNHYVTTFFQSMASSLVPVSIFYITKRIFNKSAAVIASILTCLDMNLIFLSIVIGMEALFIPMLYMAFTMVIAYFQKPDKAKLIYGLLIGVFLGFTNMVRGEALFVPFFIGILAVIFFKRSLGMRRAIAIASSLILGFSLILTLHATINYKNYNKFTFSTGQAAAAFSGSHAGIENEKLHNMGFNPFDDFARSAKVFFTNPKDVTRLMAVGFSKRVISFLFAPNFGTFDPIIIVNPGSGYVYNYSLYLLAYGYILIALGFIFAFRHMAYMFEKSIILFYILYTISIYGVIMTTNARHRGVLIPFFYMFLAYGAYRIYGFIKPKIIT